MSKPMISVAGIRGVVGDSLRVEEFFRYVLAFATLVKGGRVVLGSDSRISGNMLRHLAYGALQSAGCEVIELGMVPTPTVGIMIRHLQADGGIAITASHNPAEWNAYKFFGSHGSFLDNEAKDRLLAVAESGDFARVDYTKLGRVVVDDSAVDVHVRRVLNAVDKNLVASKNFKAVVDCVNGVGRRVAEPLLQALGCEATFLYGEPTGLFPRNPEPLPENLEELRQAVREAGADVGFAIDPDADRLAVVDETGRAIGEERTLVLAARTVLQSRVESNPDPRACIVVNLSSSRAMDDVADEFGCELVRTPIGEAWVVGQILERDALIGGEGNGGVIFPKVHPGRDAATGIALVLHGLARAGIPLSEWNRQVPDYVMVKTKFPATPEITSRLKDVVGQEFSDALDLETADGVKAIYKDKWIHVRPSGTEPVVRIFAEGASKEIADELVSRAQKLFGEN